MAGANGGQVAGATGVGSGGGGGGRTQAPPPVLNATPTNSFIVVTAGQSNAGLWFGSGFRDTYLPWVERVVQRFKDEPAVGMWELVKSASEVDAVTLRAFYDSVGGDIHHMDPNHLVESGTHAPWAYGTQGMQSGFAFIHASAGIDVASFQDYGAGGEEPPTLGETVEAMASLDKPFILSEAATFASPSGDPSQLYEGLPCISFAARRDLLASWFRTVFASGASGVEVWNYSPFSSDQCSSDISVGDPSVDLIRDFAIP